MILKKIALFQSEGWKLGGRIIMGRNNVKDTNQKIKLENVFVE